MLIKKVGLMFVWWDLPSSSSLSALPKTSERRELAITSIPCADLQAWSEANSGNPSSWTFASIWTLLHIYFLFGSSIFLLLEQGLNSQGLQIWGKWSHVPFVQAQLLVELKLPADSGLISYPIPAFTWPFCSKGSPSSLLHTVYRMDPSMVFSVDVFGSQCEVIVSCGRPDFACETGQAELYFCCVCLCERMYASLQF